MIGISPEEIGVKGWSSPEQTFSEFTAVKAKEYY